MSEPRARRERCANVTSVSWERSANTVRKKCEHILFSNFNLLLAFCRNLAPISKNLSSVPSSIRAEGENSNTPPGRVPRPDAPASAMNAGRRQMRRLRRDRSHAQLFRRKSEHGEDLPFDDGRGSWHPLHFSVWQAPHLKVGSAIDYLR